MDENQQWLKTIIDWIDKRIDRHQLDTNEKFEKLESKIDEILKWKWAIIGASGAITIVFQIVFKILELKLRN